MSRLSAAAILGALTLCAAACTSARTPQTAHADALAAWERFTRTNGTYWHVDWNDAAGTPRRISGSFLDVSDRITARNASAIALRLVRRFRDLLQADPGSLVLTQAEFLAPEKGGRGAGTWYLSLRQQHRGLPVEGGLVRFIIRDQKLTTMGADFFNGISLPSTPRLARDQAIAMARRSMGANAPQPASTHLLVWPDARSGALQYRLVWQIVMPLVSVPKEQLLWEAGTNVPLPAPGTPTADEMRPAQWRYRVDAMEGVILERVNLLVEQGVSGRVTAMARLLVPTDPQTQVDVSGLTVRATQGATTVTTATDATGNFSFPALPSGATSISASLAGPHLQVHNVEMADAAHNAMVTAPGTHDWNWSADDTSWNMIEQNAYYHVTRIRNRFLSGGPFNLSPTLAPTPVNVGTGPSTGCGACAAPTLGMFVSRPFAQCADTYYHEYTHLIVDKAYTAAGKCLQCAVQNGSMNEGWADYFSASLTNNPLYGGGCSAGRNISTPDLRLPEDWRGTVHEDGKIFSGALWDTRAVLGPPFTDGLAMRALKQGPMSGYREYLQAMLEEDDDPAFNTSPGANNNLADGTPNINAICYAYYDLHGIFRPECIGHTQSPVAVIESPPALTFPLFNRTSNVVNTPAVTITGTAAGSSSAFSALAIEYATAAAPGMWSSAGVTLSGNGTSPVTNGTMGSMSTAALADGFYLVRLRVTDAAGNTATATTNVVIDKALKPGWPKGAGEFAGSPAVADVDPAVAGLEIVARDNFGSLYVWHKDGSLMTGWPKAGGRSASPPAVGDLDGNGTLEIVTADYYGSVRAFNRDGTTVAGWPQTCGAEIYMGGAVLADLDSNGTLEILVASSNPGQVCAWNRTGTALTGWPVPMTAGSQVSIAVADLDGNGQSEVVAGTLDWKVYVWSSNGTVLPGWPQTVSFKVGASPALGDLDGDGDLEIVVGSQFDKIHAWHHTGAVLAGWPQTASTYFPASITIADVDGSGTPEVVVKSNNDAVHVWRGNGTALTGWPSSGGTGGDTFPSSPVIADLDGNGQREVLAEGNASSSAQFWSSLVWAFNRTGMMAAGWPRLLAGQITSSPAVADIDLDGKVDVVFGTSDGVYVWGFAGAFVSGPTDWLLFRHDNRRSGALVPESNVVDQQQTTIDQTVGGLATGGNSQQKLAQTVTAGIAGRLTEVRLPVACTPNADLILTIEGVTAAGAPNGTILSTKTFAASTLPVFAPAPASLRSLVLTTPVQLTAGQRYAIVLTSTGLTAAANCASFQGPAGDPYSGGNAYFDASPNPPGWVCQCTFANGRFDLPFQVVMGR